MPEKDEETKEPLAGADEAAGKDAVNANSDSAEVPSDAEPPEAGVDSGDSPLLALEAEVASLKDQLLRALAETENLRRRSQREREDAVKFAAASLVKDLLVVPDNLRRAIESVDQKAVAGNEVLQNLIKGVELTEKELLGVFEKYNIIKLEPLGERFDAHFHQAVMEVPDTSQPNGTVVQVLQTGYRYHDRLLRAAMVGVSKGGKPADAPAQPKAESEAVTEANGQPEAPRIDTSV